MSLGALSSAQPDLFAGQLLERFDKMEAVFIFFDSPLEVGYRGVSQGDDLSDDSRHLGRRCLLEISQQPVQFPPGHKLGAFGGGPGRPCGRDLFPAG